MIGGCRLLFVVLLLSGCTTTDPVGQAKQAQRNMIVRQCMNNMSNVAVINPMVLRTEIIHTCNALANRVVK